MRATTEKPSFARGLFIQCFAALQCLVPLLGPVALLLGLFYSQYLLVSITIILGSVIHRLAEHGDYETVEAENYQRIGRALKKVLLEKYKVLWEASDGRIAETLDAETTVAEAAGAKEGGNANIGIVCTANYHYNEFDIIPRAVQDEINHLKDMIMDIEFKLDNQAQSDSGETEAEETAVAEYNRIFNRRIMNIETRLAAIQGMAGDSEFTHKEARMCAIEHNERLTDCENIQDQQQRKLRVLHDMLKDLQEKHEAQHQKTNTAIEELRSTITTLSKDVQFILEFTAKLRESFKELKPQQEALGELAKTKAAIEEIHSTTNALTKQVHDNLALTGKLQDSLKKLEEAEAQLEKLHMNDQMDNITRFKLLLDDASRREDKSV